MTITFRLDEKRRNALRKLAASLGKSEPELLRDLIDREINRSSIAERAGKYLGSLSLDSKHAETDPWRKTIREHNWRK